jgi:hypothetical protein
MFPPALPRYFIEQCSRQGDVVFDPFAGRGTTPLEACLAGRIGIGSDANPLAALMTAAKVRPASVSELMDRVRYLRIAYSRADVVETAPPEIQMLFDGRRTLPQLLFLRSRLKKNLDCDRFLLGTLCGILHGNHPLDPRNARTLSISMPNTFCMAPGYIRRYVRSHKLRKYPVDVFDCLERRLLHLFRDAAPVVRGRARRSDARQVSTWLPKESVSLIVTSPPYLQAVRYGKFNWIRLWLLGHSVEDVDRKVHVERTDLRLRLSDRFALPRYCDFIESTLKECSAILKPGGSCVLVIGDVRTPHGDDLNLARAVWSRVKRDVNLRLESEMVDEIKTSIKVTRIWGGRRGLATNRDRILLLRKPGGLGPRRVRPDVVLANLQR